MTGIYKITNLKNQKYYIGASTNIITRWGDHVRRLTNGKHNKRFQKDFDKYGIQAFSFQVLELCLNKNLYDREKFHITQHKACDWDKGYNQKSQSGKVNKDRRDNPVIIHMHHKDIDESELPEFLRTRHIRKIYGITDYEINLLTENGLPYMQPGGKGHARIFIKDEVDAYIKKYLQK